MVCWSALLALAVLVEALPQTGLGESGSGTLIRFGCTQVVIERLDPLVNPGANPSPHLHQIIGGNAFNASIPSTDVSNLATCTTCSYAEDLSNYWTANLFFKARNGTYKRVPQAANRLLFGDTFSPQTGGGTTVYYVSPGPQRVTAFKPGFRMLVGDSMQREKIGNGRKSQSCFRCFTGPDFGGDNAAPCADKNLDFEEFPPHPCLGGIRSNILFPTCWDGQSLDSPDHRSHVAYPTTGPAAFTGNIPGECPDTHPVKIPQLMLEIHWDTTAFNNKEEWPEDGSQPLVLSTGDPTGYGQHGDYVFGWQGDSLQRAMDGACIGATCADLKTQSVEEAKSCTVEDTVNEDFEGWLTQLPGDGSGA